MALLEDLALYDNESWNDLSDFAKPVKAISFPQDIPSISDRHLIQLENQVQCLMETHLAPKSSIQVKKITSSCEICSGPHDTQYCMENPEQAFVDYTSSHTDKAGGKWFTFKPKQNNLGETYNLSWKTKGDLRKFSDIGAWYAIEDCAQYDKKCSNPTSAISNETIANPNVQIVGDDMVRVQVPRCMAWLNYDKHVDSLSTLDNEVGVTSLEGTTQTLPSFEEYTPPITYPKDVKKTLGTPIEVEPLNETKLEGVGLNCNHNTPISYREVPSFDKPEPQPQPLPNCPP
ncbi:hypothetical protein Tco_1102605 [Tanacetum coccineum]